MTPTLRGRLQGIEIAHADGPITERIAAAEHTESGRRETNLSRVVEAVRAHPGFTALELSRSLADIDPYEVRRRLTDAKRLGFVRQGEPVYRAHLRPQMSWWPVLSQRRLW